MPNSQHDIRNQARAHWSFKGLLLRRPHIRRAPSSCTTWRTQLSPSYAHSIDSLAASKENFRIDTPPTLHHRENPCLTTCHRSVVWGGVPAWHRVSGIETRCQTWSVHATRECSSSVRQSVVSKLIMHSITRREYPPPKLSTSYALLNTSLDGKHPIKRVKVHTCMQVY